MRVDSKSYGDSVDEEINEDLLNLCKYICDQKKIDEESVVAAESIKSSEINADSSNDLSNYSSQSDKFSSNSEIPAKIIPPEQFGTGANRNVYNRFRSTVNCYVITV